MSLADDRDNKGAASMTPVAEDSSLLEEPFLGRKSSRRVLSLLQLALITCPWFGVQFSWSAGTFASCCVSLRATVAMA
mgnify:CR=1 FL=1